MPKAEQINKNKLPKHVAIIMDGNGRWAKQKGKPRIIGHQNGAKSVRAVIEAATELGIQYLTLYAFSTENWNRPKMEVDALMELLVSSIDKELNNLVENDIKLNIIGNTSQLPSSVQKKLQFALTSTAHCSRMTLTIALSYSGRWDIVEAVKRLINDGIPGDLDAINEKTFAQYLSTASLPYPELLIRTSGEYRLSNYLLWELAYSELYFTKTLWPDFGKDDFHEAILDFQSRERRFGKTSEQLG